MTIYGSQELWIFSNETAGIFSLQAYKAMQFFPCAGSDCHKIQKALLRAVIIFCKKKKHTHTKLCQHVERNIAVAQQRFWHHLCLGNNSYPTPTSKNLIMHQWRECVVLWRMNEILRVENQMHGENVIYKI